MTVGVIGLRLRRHDGRQRYEISRRAYAFRPT